LRASLNAVRRVLSIIALAGSLCQAAPPVATAVVVGIMAADAVNYYSAAGRQNADVPRADLTVAHDQCAGLHRRLTQRRQSALSLAKSPGNP
jgi:hypothetical protein